MWLWKAKQRSSSNDLVHKNILFNSFSIIQSSELNYSIRNSIAKISCNSMLNVIDYLNFVELKEVGKVNRMHNYLSKQNEI